MQRMRVNPGRISVEEESELRRGPWTLEEDTLLTHYVSHHGEGRWNMLAKSAGLKRTGKSCRLRWLNYLKPDIKRGNLTPQEQLLILELHSKWGNRWSKIAQCLPGRTDNEIKNYWRTRVQKQARQLNIESNSKRFIDAVRGFWMPRLLQKMEQSSSSSSHPSQYNNYNYNNNNNFPQLPNNNYPTISPSSPISTNSLLPNANNNINSTHENYPSDIPSDFTEVSQQQWHKTEVAATENPSGPNDYRNAGQSNYYDQISNDMDGLSFNYSTDITSTASEIDYYNVHSSSFECHMVDGDWASNYVGDALWNNMDDIWQLRE